MPCNPIVECCPWLPLRSQCKYRIPYFANSPYFHQNFVKVSARNPVESVSPPSRDFSVVRGPDLWTFSVVCHDRPPRCRVGWNCYWLWLIMGSLESRPAPHRIREIRGRELLQSSRNPRRTLKTNNAQGTEPPSPFKSMNIFILEMPFSLMIKKQKTGHTHKL